MKTSLQLVIPALLLFGAAGFCRGEDYLDSHAQPEPVVAMAAGGETLTVHLTGGGTLGGWRLVGERRWRASGETAIRMLPGAHWVEFRAVNGWTAPVRAEREADGGAHTFHYSQDTDPPLGQGWARVGFDGGVGGWRLVGETGWRSAGEAAMNLAPGNAIVEFIDVAGYSRPASKPVEILANQGVFVSARYHPNPPGSAWGFTRLSSVPSDDRHISEAPYCYLGRIDSPYGTFTGVAVGQYTVLTTLQAIRDAETGSLAEGVTWSWAGDGSFAVSPPQTPAGFVLMADWNAAALQDPGNQVVALYFRTPAAGGGFSGHHPWLEAGRASMAVAYRVLDDEVAPFATGPVPMPQVGGGAVFSISNIHLFEGAAGAPLFTRRSNGTWYPAAILFDDDAGGSFRRIDAAVAQLIEVAEAAALRGKGGTFSDGNRLGSQYGIGSPTKGRIRTVILDPVAARWLVGGNGQYTSGSAIEVNSGEYQVGFLHVDGYEKPSTKTVKVASGVTAEVMASYIEIAKEWVEQAFSAEQRQMGNTGPLEDFDGDGLQNILEWAFGLNPTVLDHWQPGDGPTGMPVIEKSDDQGGKLTVSYLRRKNAAAAGVTYRVEFASAVGGTWVEANGEGVNSLNTEWERVTVVDPATVAPNRRFARVAIEEAGQP
jgi:hypothetical protein